MVCSVMVALLKTHVLYHGNVPAKALHEDAKVWPPTTFDPKSLSGLAVWLDASQLPGATGSNVSPWPNLATGGPPGTMYTNPGNDILPIVSTNTLNGKKLVRFYNSQARMRMTGHGVELEYTLAYVARMVPGGVMSGRIMTSVYPPTNFLIGYWNGFEDVAYSSSGAFWDRPGGNPQKSVTTNWRLYSSDAGPGDTAWLPRLLNNGVQISQSSAAVGNRGNDGWLGSMNIPGYDATSTAETCDCEIAEVLLYNRKLPDVDRQKVENYLRTKWALS
jgi:hypothetical protein